MEQIKWQGCILLEVPVEDVHERSLGWVTKWRILEQIGQPHESYDVACEVCLQAYTVRGRGADKTRVLRYAPMRVVKRGDVWVPRGIRYRS